MSAPDVSLARAPRSERSLNLLGLLGAKVQFQGQIRAVEGARARRQPHKVAMAEASQHDDLAEILAEASQQQQQDPTNIVARLKRAYVNEKNAPELLPFEHDLLEQVMAKVEDQELVVQQSREAAAAAGGGGGGGGGGGMDDLMAHIYQAELNRVRFLIRAYYRTRLFKIEKYAVHVVKPETNEFAKLSPQEQEYAKNYVNMLEEHFGSVLGQMPEKYRACCSRSRRTTPRWTWCPSQTSTSTCSAGCARTGET